uniref:Uncharacterized protein n=1 Tax=Caenorhabditis japonica TaxID=281687 RepID=A0A8R1EF47_CAEJA
MKTVHQWCYTNFWSPDLNPVCSSLIRQVTQHLSDNNRQGRKGVVYCDQTRAHNVVDGRATRLLCIFPRMIKDTATL